MNKLRVITRLALMVPLLVLLRSVPAQAQGDKVLAQVADGTSGDGTQFITKLRITNISPDTTKEIKKLKVMFVLQNGTPWTISTNLGTASEFPLDLGSFQTLALNTSSAGTLTQGYAIVRNTDGQTDYPDDYQVAVTAFYEVRKAGSAIDTISVPVSQPTVSFVLPVEIDDPNKLYTGFAIVNLSNIANGVTLQLFQATSPSSGAAPSAGTQKITLNPGEQRAVFLYPTIFPSASSFKGMLQGLSEKPVAILALLQTPTPTGVQYATIVPAYIDSLRRNTSMYLRLGYPLDADLPVSDYFDQTNDSTPWDLVFERLTDTTRQLTPQSGAQFASIGQKTDVDFDALTIADLQTLSYSSNPIDMSDNSPNLPSNVNSSLGYYAFAIKTGLGRYVKVRVIQVISYAAPVTDKDLVLEIFVFK